MQREHCTYTKRQSSAALTRRDCSAFALLCSLLCSLVSIADASQQRATHHALSSMHVQQDAYGETRTSLLDLASPKPTRAGRQRHAIRARGLFPVASIGGPRARERAWRLLREPRGLKKKASRAPENPSTAVTVPRLAGARARRRRRPLIMSRA